MGRRGDEPFAGAEGAKEERFAYLYVELGNGTNAYREVYGDNTNIRQACYQAYRLAHKPHVAALIASLRAQHAENHHITVAHLLDELDEARAVALTSSIPQTSTAVAATMGKAKLLGMDKQVLELSGKDGAPLAVTVNFVKPKGE